jgi:alkanesulfonate monooxygenase SsuD/methylene tetrahydromethanopterin reductase-like flavin-dependent oxidoreductase (luciferase family)
VKASLFCTTRYEGPVFNTQWPAPGDKYSAEWGERSMRSTLERFRLGDEVGFDWVTVAEHHFAPFSMTPNSCVMAAALTNVVKRAKVAILGPIIPILDPVRVAEEMAMIDTLTNGRVIAGLMRGSPNEYVTYNTNAAESRERFEEALELIRMAWTETQPFGWLGRYYEYRAISIWPRQVQHPHPPIYISASSPESGEFAARHRLGAAFAFTTLQIAAEGAKYYRAQCQKEGWEPNPDQLIYRLAVHVADTDEQAIEDMVRTGGEAASSAGEPVSAVSRNSLFNRNVEKAVATSGYFGRDIETQQARLRSRGDLDRIKSRTELTSRVDKGQLLVGSPATVLKQIKRINEQLGGVGVLDLVVPSQLGDKTLRNIELLGTKVLPKIREL